MLGQSLFWLISSGAWLTTILCYTYLWSVLWYKYGISLTEPILVGLRLFWVLLTVVSLPLCFCLFMLLLSQSIDALGMPTYTLLFGPFFFIFLHILFRCLLISIFPGQSILFFSRMFPTEESKWSCMILWTIGELAEFIKILYLCFWSET